MGDIIRMVHFLKVSNEKKIVELENTCGPKSTVDNFNIARVDYAMTIRLGASSGAALGKVTVSTPFSMAALTSSSLDLLSAFYSELAHGLQGNLP